MGRASRAKQERREIQTTAPPAGGIPRRALWIGAAGLAAAIVAVVVVIVATGSSSTSYPLPAADQVAADENASPALVAASRRSGFYLASEPNTGVIETEPADASPEPRSTLLLDVGTTAPDFTLETPQGEALQLAGLRGKAVLLEFFATWCGLCNTEAPHLRKLAASLPASKVAFVSINADGEDAASVFAYHHFHKLPFPSLLDPGVRQGSFRKPGVPGPVSRQYGMKSLPTFYVIDRKGKITWRSDGEQPDAKLRQELKRAAGL